MVVNNRLMNSAIDLLKIITKQFVFKLYLAGERLFQGPFSKYDFQTFSVLKRSLRTDSTCIDIGANVGHVLRQMIKAAPKGNHYAFEPIPDLVTRLRARYSSHARIFELALSNENGESSFMYYKDAPALSGFTERPKWGNHEICALTVKTSRLDEIIPIDARIDLIKIDVEGAELLVLEGAVKTLRKNRPIVLFEAGLGGAGQMTATPEKLFDLFDQCGMVVGLLEYHLRGKSHFSRDEFCGQFYKGYNYFYIAYDPLSFTAIA